MLRQLVVRDIRIIAHHILFPQTRAKFGQRRTRRPAHQASKPLRRFAPDVLINKFLLRLRKHLHRHPNLRLRMRGKKRLRHIRQERQHQFRWILPRIPAREKNPSQLRSVFEKFRRAIEQIRTLHLIIEIEIRRYPHPIIEPVPIADFSNRPIHFAPRKLHHRCRTLILKRNPLDAVRSEKSQFANILLKLLRRPGVVRIRLRAIPKLVSSNRIFGRRRDIDRRSNTDLLLREIRNPQKITDAEKRPPSIRAHDPHRDLSLGLINEQMIAFRLLDR